ncbi:ribonuclease YeeF family protein [Psychrobacillus sp. NPDC096389]|uniref:ribonuclease YeeF family protein n=1 Tax=Psychrobacillus sp. NPDC096389 TaxID=3364490 RepID=UPI0037F6EC85
MKVLDVDLFQDGIHRNITMLDRLGKEMETIQKSVDGLVAMEEVLKGEGGNTIRAFYAECHIPFLQFFQLFQNRFTSVLKQIEAALNALEPDPAGYILEQFQVGEVEEGLQQIAQLTETLTNETNSIMDQVADIVGLPHLDDSGVQLGVRDAKIKRDDTVTRLHEFDATQTKALWSIEDNLHTMESWITNIEGLFKEGLTDIHFQADRWAVLSSENKLKTDLALQKVTLGALTDVEGLDIQPETMLRAFLANMNRIMFGLNGLIHKPNAFWGPSILAFSTIPNKPVLENQLNKPAMTEEEQLEALYAELAKHPNIGNSSNDAPIDPATGDYMITYEGMRKVLGGNGSGTPDGLAPYAVAAFNFYTEDIATMFGSDSTMDERMLAAAFTFIKPAKMADAGHDLVKTAEKAREVGKGIDNPLLPTEGKVGTFKELAKQGTAFDNITPHHIPSAAKMKQAGVKRNDGVSMNMEQPHPGVGGRHRETYTYGLSGNKLEEYLNLSYRDALTHDILDARRIYMKGNVYTPEIRAGLLNTIRKNKELYPELFKK